MSNTSLHSSITAEASLSEPNIVTPSSLQAPRPSKHSQNKFFPERNQDEPPTRTKRYQDPFDSFPSESEAKSKPISRAKSPSRSQSPSLADRKRSHRPRTRRNKAAKPSAAQPQASASQNSRDGFIFKSSNQDLKAKMPASANERRLGEFDVDFETVMTHVPVPPKKRQAQLGAKSDSSLLPTGSGTDANIQNEGGNTRQQRKKKSTRHMHLNFNLSGLGSLLPMKPATAKNKNTISADEIVPARDMASQNQTQIKTTAETLKKSGGFVFAKKGFAQMRQPGMGNRFKTKYIVIEKGSVSVFTASETMSSSMIGHLQLQSDLDVSLSPETDVNPMENVSAALPLELSLSLLDLRSITYTRRGDKVFGLVFGKTIESHDDPLRKKFLNAPLGRVGRVIATGTGVAPENQVDSTANIYQEKEYQFKFSKARDCEVWLAGLLVELTNQAQLLEATSDALITVSASPKAKIPTIQNLEAMETTLRQCVDMYQLGCGAVNNKTIRAQYKLGKFLQKIDKSKQEGNYWLSLAQKAAKQLGKLVKLELPDFLLYQTKLVNPEIALAQLQFQTQSIIQIKRDKMRIVALENQIRKLRGIAPDAEKVKVRSTKASERENEVANSLQAQREFSLATAAAEKRAVSTTTDQSAESTSLEQITRRPMLRRSRSNGKNRKTASKPLRKMRDMSNSSEISLSTDFEEKEDEVRATGSQRLPSVLDSEDEMEGTVQVDDRSNQGSKENDSLGSRQIQITQPAESVQVPTQLIVMPDLPSSNEGIKVRTDEVEPNAVTPVDEVENVRYSVRTHYSQGALKRQSRRIPEAGTEIASVSDTAQEALLLKRPKPIVVVEEPQTPPQCFLMRSELNNGTLFMKWSKRDLSSEALMKFTPANASKIPRYKYKSGLKLSKRDEVVTNVNSSSRRVLEGVMLFIKQSFKYEAGVVVPSVARFNVFLYDENTAQIDTLASDLAVSDIQGQYNAMVVADVTSDLFTGISTCTKQHFLSTGRKMGIAVEL